MKKQYVAPEAEKVEFSYEQNVVASATYVKCPDTYKYNGYPECPATQKFN